jgi:hypothetical protein
VSTVDTLIDTLGRQQPAKRRGKTKEPPTPNVANVPEDQFEEQVESDKPPSVQALAKQGVTVSDRSSGEPAKTDGTELSLPAELVESERPQAAADAADSAASESAPPAEQTDRDAKALAAWRALTPEMQHDLHAKRDALAAKLTDDQYDIVESLWTLHQLLLHGELNEKNLSAIIEVQPSFDSLGLIDLGKAIGDLGRAWKSRERRAQQDKPTQKETAPSADDFDGVPSFLDRRPGAGANGNRIAEGS